MPGKSTKENIALKRRLVSHIDKIAQDTPKGRIAVIDPLNLPENVLLDGDRNVAKRIIRSLLIRRKHNPKTTYDKTGKLTLGETDHPRIELKPKKNFRHQRSNQYFEILTEVFNFPPEDNLTE